MLYGKRTLCGLGISRLCLGTLTVGPLQLGLTVECGAEVISRAVGHGINIIDTAQIYGTYPHIAKAAENGGLDGVVVSSKTYAYTEASAMEAVDEARRETGLDKIGVFMLHEQESIHTIRGHADALRALHKCKERGVIGAVGISTHRVAGVHAAVDYGGFDLVHPILNIAGLGITDSSRADMESAVERAHRAGCFILAMKPLGGGNLHNSAEEALRYILSLDYVDSVALGMGNPAEADANVWFLEHGSFPCGYGENLPPKRLHIDGWCTACGKCVARCPSGAISVAGGKARCDAEKCVLCGYCSAVCGEFCIKII